MTVYTSDLERDRPLVRLACLPSVERGLENVTIRRFTAVKIANLRWGLGIIAPWMLPSALRLRYDIVHAHAIGYWPTFVGMAKRIYDGTPLVVTSHSNPGSRDYGAIDMRTVPLRFADGLVALTEAERRYLISLGMRRDRIVVIPNGVSWAKFQSRTKRRSDRRVLYVGRIDVRHKGCDTLVKAMAIVVRKIPDATLILVGPDWGDGDRVTSLAKSLGIGGRVKYVGVVSEEEKVNQFAMADVCVLPSNIEPFGIVALEAMASGKPLVATNVGGLRELVRNGESGLLVPCRDEVKLAEGIVFLLKHGSVARQMGSKGRAFARRYSWQVVTDKVERLYQSLTSLGSN